VFNLLSESNLTRSTRRRAVALSVFAHVVSTAILIVFHIVYAASVPVRFVTELEVGRSTGGTLYLPFAGVTGTRASLEPRRISVPRSVAVLADATLTPIPTEIQDLAGSEVPDPGRLPLIPAIHTMEPAVLGVNPPEPIPELEALEKPAPPPDESEKPVVKIGGRVVPAKIVSQQAPIYPENARRARVEGAVTLNAVVSTQGILQEIRIVSGHPLLVEAALDCVRKWRYRPGTLNEQAIEMPITIRVVFKLNFTQ
jgi:TonB family protein